VSLDFIPSALLAPFIRHHLEHPTNTLTDLAALSGISDRHIMRLVDGIFATCRLETADALLIAMGKEEAWHTDPGLAELYETNGNGAVAGEAENRAATEPSNVAVTATEKMRC
jgi:hypothetical protein